LSETAIEVARTNAKNLHQEIQFRTGNLLDPLRSVSFPKNATVLILANLPYIKDADHIHMSEDTRHEPALALYGGPKTGFELYEQFFAQTEKFFEDKGLKSLTIIAEIGFDQGAYATTYLSNFSGKTEILHDLTSTPRFILYEIVK
jgi:release factor glutamine methyltransferase